MNGNFRNKFVSGREDVVCKRSENINFTICPFTNIICTSLGWRVHKLLPFWKINIYFIKLTAILFLLLFYNHKYLVGQHEGVNFHIPCLHKIHQKVFHQFCSHLLLNWFYPHMVGKMALLVMLHLLCWIQLFHLVSL